MCHLEAWPLKVALSLYLCVTYSPAPKAYLVLLMWLDCSERGMRGTGVSNPSAQGDALRSVTHMFYVLSLPLAMPDPSYLQCPGHEEHNLPGPSD
jgi:hypothetical protein